MQFFVCVLLVQCGTVCFHCGCFFKFYETSPFFSFHAVLKFLFYELVYQFPYLHLADLFLPII